MALGPVSYTHLDVYKRQEQLHIFNFLIDIIQLPLALPQLHLKLDVYKRQDYISDVDVSRQRAKKIAALLNRFAVHPHDVRDVIEDIRDDPHF